MESHTTSKCERERRFKQGKENKRYNLTPIGVFDFNRGCYVLIVGYTIYKKQSEKAIDTGLDDVAEEILAKVKSAGQLKEMG